MASAAVLATIGLTGCTIEAVAGQDVEDYGQVADVRPRFRERLDILFVIDDTDGMAARQQELGEVFRVLQRNIDLAEGEPSVHLGVVSANMGAPGGLAGCDSSGDDGALQRAAEACLGVGPAWLEFGRGVGPPGTMIPGVGGDATELETAFACMTALGEAGCAVEQPLAAMRRALDGSQAANDGFLRDDAALAVMMLAGEDDCSGSPGLFDVDGVDKFRCFREGVRCRSDDVNIGAQVDCHPNTRSSLMVDVDAEVEFLHGLKGDPEAVVGGALVGDPNRVTVVDPGDGNLALAPACQRGGGDLFPGVRLGAFASKLGGTATPLCSEGPRAAIVAMNHQIREALGHRCLAGQLRDVEPEAPGVQVDCIVSARAADGTTTQLQACDNIYWMDGPAPCFGIKVATRCNDFPSQLGVWVNWGGATPDQAPMGTHTVVSCLTDDGTDLAAE